jgi:hypothetical protein
MLLCAILSLGSVAHAHPGHPHPVQEVDEFENEAALTITAHDLISCVWYSSLVAAAVLLALALRNRRNDLFPE